jgi:competence protein ComEC
MIDINNSQDYDSESFTELVKEERKKADASRARQAGLAALSSQNPLMAGALALNRLGGLGALGAQPNALAQAYDSVYADAARDAAIQLTDPIDFLQRTYPGKSLFRFILTHPDLDHMRGLKRLHEAIGFTNFWDTSHTKPTPDFRSDADREDWEFYQSIRPTAKNYKRGDALLAFGRDENGVPGGDDIEILSPTPALVTSCNRAGKSNDLSIVLRLRHAGRSFLLAGDAEAEAWDDMVAHYGTQLKSDYLKASHHGRDSGYHLDALKHIAPRITFVSVGRKPDTDASSKYRQQCNKVASTRFYGNMELRIDDSGAVEWFVQRNSDN